MFRYYDHLPQSDAVCTRLWRSAPVRCASDVRRLCSLATLDALANPTLGLDERHAINVNR